MSAQGVDVMALWAKVEAAMVKTVLAAQALQRLPKRRPGSCVDLFGFDVMFDTALNPFVLEVNLAPALNTPEPGVNQRVHDRVLLQLIALLSRRQDPSSDEAEATRRQLQLFAPKHNFSFCEAAHEVKPGNMKGAEGGGETAWGSALAYAAPIECIDDDAVAEVWRLTQETQALGLWDRIYPKNDGETDRFGRFWLHNGQGQGTVGKRGPSFLQRLTASWAQHELDGDAARASLTVAQWIDALREDEPARPARAGD